MEILHMKKMADLVQKQDQKNVKRCRDGRPKVRKQGRDGIIVKVNLQSPIPASFYITIAK